MADTNLAPYFRLRINNGGGDTTLPAGYFALLQSVTVEASVDGADELTIVAWARDPDSPPGHAWRFIGEKILGPGTLVAIEAGYRDGGAPTVLQRFVLHAESANYDQNGIPTVKIRGFSAESRLGVYTRPRTFKAGISDSQIAHDIALEHGLQVTHDTIEHTTGKHPARVKKSGESDLVFLQKLAIANGYGPPIVRYDAAKRADMLYFRPQRVEPANVNDLVYSPADAGSSRPGGLLLDFQPELDLHGVPTKVEVTGWDKTRQQPIVVIAEISEAGQEPTFLTGNATIRAGYHIKSGSQMQARALKSGHEPVEPKPLKSGGVSKVKNKTEVLSVPSLHTLEEAIAWAKRWLSLRNAAFMTARGATVGIPSLWVSQVHRVSGVAPSHAGLWEVVKCKHNFAASGYTCALDLERVLEEKATAKGGPA